MIPENPVGFLFYLETILDGIMLVRKDQIADHESVIDDIKVVFNGDLKIRGFNEHVASSLRVIYGSFDISELHISDLANLERITGNLRIRSERKTS